MGDGERILNLWEGFKPSIISVFDKTKKFEESCPILHEYFLKSLSSGSEEVYSYLLRWDTDAIVNPQRLAGRTALFLHSRKGRNGKNTKFRLMRAIIGEKHCFDTSRAKSTDGGFTEHFANQYLLCFSETFSDSKRGPLRTLPSSAEHTGSVSLMMKLPSTNRRASVFVAPSIIAA